MAKSPRIAARPRRRDVVIARTRDDILVAAARAVGRSGFGSVSMQEIAAEVGFTAPALYAYFSSKEEIFSELVRTLDRELLVTFEAPLGVQPFRRRLSLLLDRQLEWADRRRDVFVAFMALHMRGENVHYHEPAEEHGPHAYLRALTAWLAEAIERPGDLGGHSPEDAACLLMGIGHGFFMRWLGAESPGRLAERTDQILDFFFHGVMGPPTASPAPARPSRSPRRTRKSS